MEYEQPTARSISLWEEDEYPIAHPDDGFRPWLDPYPLETDTALGAVLICPGGGYGCRARHEGIQIAEAFNRLGLHAFVVHYSVAPRRHPQPLRDAGRAIRIIRRRASEWRVDPAHIAILGFSAGGHLAGSLGVHYDKSWLSDPSPFGKFTARPDALILCYAVLSSGPFMHAGSFYNLLGPDPDPAFVATMGLENQINDATPPAFLWHTADDSGVPVENSLLFAGVLRRHCVPFELHVFGSGPHGLGLATDDPHIATWFPLCVQWLTSNNWISAAKSQ